MSYVIINILTHLIECMKIKRNKIRCSQNGTQNWSADVINYYIVLQLNGLKGFQVQITVSTFFAVCINLNRKI